MFIKSHIINLSFCFVMGLWNDVWNKVVVLGLPKPQTLGFDVMKQKKFQVSKFKNFFLDMPLSMSFLGILNLVVRAKCEGVLGANFYFWNKMFEDTKVDSKYILWVV